MLKENWGISLRWCCFSWMLLVATNLTPQQQPHPLFVSSFLAAQTPARLLHRSGMYETIFSSNHEQKHRSFLSSNNDNSNPAPLCDLQTLLRLADCGVDTGGAAKMLIQAGEVSLNGATETRRAKKLFPGDVVSFKDVEYSVHDIVQNKGYVYKAKEKNPAKKRLVVKGTDEFGNPIYGGRVRSEEWRAERRERKAERQAERSEEWRAEQRERKAERKAERKQQRQDHQVSQLRDHLSKTKPTTNTKETP